MPLPAPKVPLKTRTAENSTIDLRPIYLDNNATTESLPEVCEAILRALGINFGNAASAHTTGDKARRALREARCDVSRLIGAEPERLFFTGSGTEANNMVLASVAQSNAVIVTTPVEHSSILSFCEHLEGRGVEIFYLPIDATGRIGFHALEQVLSQQQTTLVSVQWVNNETGVIQPVEQIRALCRSAGVLFHTDAAQAVGKLDVDVAVLDPDFLTLTAHKFHGPPGVGAVYAKQPHLLKPLLFGGPQEGGLRAGTENLPGIIGAGVAAALRQARLPKVRAGLENLRDALEVGLLSEFPWIEVNGTTEDRVCNTTNLRFTGIDGQALVARLDQVDIRCSQSSACTNQKPEPSYVLRAMGLSEEEAYASIRFSFGEHNTAMEVDAALSRIFPIVRQLKALFS
jgi:cysteine desulfurase